MSGPAAATREAGFSLVELAVVLAVLGVLIGSVIRPIMADLENRALDETRRVLAEAHAALLGYVASNGYLPCPADAASNGRENPLTNHATGDCGIWHGFLPAVTLGVTAVDAQGYAVDGGRQPQNRIRYAVTNQAISTVLNPFTRVGGIRSVPVLSGEAENLLIICGSGSGVNADVDCGTASTLASRAVAVVWSVGGNATTGGLSADEAENPNPGPYGGGSADRIFVSRSRNVTAGAEFDDIVTWISLGLFVNRLLASGRIP